MVRLEILAEDYQPLVISNHHFDPRTVGSLHPIVKAFERLGIVKDEYVMTVCLHSHQLVLIAKDYTAILIPLPDMLFNGHSGVHIFHIGDNYARTAFKSPDSSNREPSQPVQGVYPFTG
jgi:hypothetical protein